MVTIVTRKMKLKEDSFNSALRGFKFSHSNRNGLFDVTIIKIVDWAFYEDGTIKIIVDINLEYNTVSVKFNIHKDDSSSGRLALYVDAHFFNKYTVFKKSMMKIVYEEECFIICEQDAGYTVLGDI